MSKKLGLLVLSLIVGIGLTSSGLLFAMQPTQPVTAASTKLDRRLKMKKMPKHYRQLAADSQRGRVEQITYQTTYRNKTYQKKALVYLPAGYATNATKRYDILYLLHGATMSETSFLGHTGTDSTSRFKTLLDHEIAACKMKPTIVVTPTYYPDDRFVTSDYERDDPLNLAFARNELPNDLLPVVEKQYRTYARATDKKGLAAARRHRAFGGFSMGAITTWYVFEHDLNLFKYYVPMAGDSWTVAANGGGIAPSKTATKLARQMQRRDYQTTDFRILASVGGADGTSGSMAPQIRQMRQHPQQFTDQNLLYSIDAGGGHDLTSAANQAYNAFTQLFRK
ncbi:alpha/beta hydrolase [Loigolactobacillus binensis]|uniref:Alpha/beta hydrolase n=1 Tax=Loigolactobacillus binensis TaxID=2559922 RepID=A0ABW3EEJ2_9LACO|nr:alpha/beta hydrolase-fold protein [Loigolactobacillus binensis]